MNVDESTPFAEMVAGHGRFTLEWPTGMEPPIKVIQINEVMVNDPFLIAEALIITMKEWYHHQQWNHMHRHHRFAAFVQLSDLLVEMQDDRNLNSMHFQRLHIALQTLFPVESGELQMASDYTFFYYWVYYREVSKHLSCCLLIKIL